MMPQPSPLESRGIAARLDRLPVTALHTAIVVVCALGPLFDVVEAALIWPTSSVSTAGSNSSMIANGYTSIMM